jgi:DNA-binding MarR family transcriptional regulator
VKAPDLKILQIAQLLSEERGLSQRDIFLRLDMAQGLVNRYLKLLAKRGWIKLTTAPAKRMRYWMTPKGMSEKTRLALQFVTSNYRLFREAHQRASNILCELSQKGVRRIAFFGSGPLAEVAAMSLAENGQILVAVIMPGSNPATSYLGVPTVSLQEAASIECDGVLLIAEPGRRVISALPSGAIVMPLLPARTHT